MKRLGVVVAAVALLTGCGLPVGVQMASLAIQGISLAATEKTPSDHVISMVAEKDCATWRALTGEPICSDQQPAESAVMVAEAATPRPTPDEPTEPSSWALPAVAVAPLPDIADFVTAAGPAEAVAASDTPASAPAIAVETAAPLLPAPQVPAPRVAVAKAVAAKSPAPPSTATAAVPATGAIYLVVASFDTTERARQLAGRHASLKPQVVKGEAKGNTVYRVVVGPVAKSGQGAERRRLEAAGLKDAWALPSDAVQVVKASPVKPIQVAAAVIGR